METITLRMESLVGMPITDSKVVNTFSFVTIAQHQLQRFPYKTVLWVFATLQSCRLIVHMFFDNELYLNRIKHLYFMCVLLCVHYNKASRAD